MDEAGTREGNHRGIIPIFGVVCVLAVAAITWVVLTSKPYYFRDPTRPGSTDAYDRLMDETLSQMSDYEEVLDWIVIETNASEIRITMPAYNGYRDRADNADFDYRHLDLGEVFECEDGRVWVEGVAVVYGEFPGDKLGDYSIQLPARFFDTELNELSEETIAALEEQKWERAFEFEGLFPALRFIFQSDVPRGGKVFGFHVFDATTHKELSSSFSWGFPLNDRGRVTTDLPMWHPTPIEFVVDVALGEPQVFEFPARAGERLIYPEGGIELVAKTSGTSYFTTSSNGKTKTVTFPYLRDQSGQKGSDVLLAILPGAQNVSLTCEFLDTGGHVINTRGSTWSDIFFKQNIDGSADAVETVRVTYYPNRKRLIFRLPEIPGLPEENRGLDNLFDVRIPFMKIDTSWEFSSAVGSLTQLSMRSNPSPGGQFSGPMVFRNITVRELVDEWAKLYGPTHGALIDQENMTIEFVDMSLKARLDRLIKTIKARLR